MIYLSIISLYNTISSGCVSPDHWCWSMYAGWPSNLGWHRRILGDTVEFWVTPSIFSRLSNDIAINSQYIQHNVSGYVFHTIDVDKYVLDKRGARVTPSNFEWNLYFGAALSILGVTLSILGWQCQFSHIHKDIPINSQYIQQS